MKLNLTKEVNQLKTLKISVDDELLKKLEEKLLQEMMQISETSLDFWDNEMDDEAWKY